MKIVLALLTIFLLAAPPSLADEPTIMELVDDWVIYLPMVESGSGIDPYSPVVGNLPIAIPDPLYQSQWGAHAINLPFQPPAADGPIIAVLDTGWDYTVPDQPNLVPGFDTIDWDDNPQSTENHGIHLISVLGSPHDRIGIAGICPNCRIMPIRVCEHGRCSEVDVVKGVQVAVLAGATIINMSFGSYTDMPYFHQWGVDWALDRGVTIIAARGNGGDDRPFYPASWDGVISVSALDKNLEVASWSSTGGDYSAPGYQVLGRCNWGYCLLSGTSIAAIHVTGVLGSTGELHAPMPIFRSTFSPPATPPPQSPQ